MDSFGVDQAPPTTKDKAAASPVFGWAILAYAVSFGLAAVSREGASIPGLECAYLTLVRPLVMDSRFFEGKAMEFIALLIIGWINIVFLASLAMRWWEGNRRPFKILRTITLLMIPFCWIVFYNEGLNPREGHVLWVVAMVVALFSESGAETTPLGLPTG